jgi:outer membrane protein
MKIKYLLPGGLLLFSAIALQAQEKKPLSLDEAISIAVSQSTEAGLANTRVTTSQYEVDNAKNTAYPDFKISGQYLRLTNPTVNYKLATNEADSNEEEGTTTASPTVNQIMFGQASLNMPMFAGFRIKNSIAASENMYQAQTYNAANTKEQIAMRTIILYANLYKAQQSVTLIQENLKSANQRVIDFTAMEENGLIARNDLLKSQLQASNIQLSLDDANKMVSTLNYQLVTLLKLQPGTQIAVSDAYFKNAGGITPSVTEGEAITQRSDLEALRWQKKAYDANVKVAKSDFYPALSLTAGYLALNIQDVLSVYNAVNVGVGVSYDISNIFKNTKRVKAAQSRSEEVRQQVDILTDQVKVQVQESLENYNLSLKQNRVYTEAVAQADENYRIVKDKYDNGLVDTNDLLEADVQKLQSQLNQAFSKADITQRFYELLNASGKLTNSFNLTPNK